MNSLRWTLVHWREFKMLLQTSWTQTSITILNLSILGNKSYRWDHCPHKNIFFNCQEGKSSQKKSLFIIYYFLVYYFIKKFYFKFPTQIQCCNLGLETGLLIQYFFSSNQYMLFKLLFFTFLYSFRVSRKIRFYPKPERFTRIMIICDY